VTDVGAVVGAARAVRAKLLRIAAHRLEIAPADLELRDGAVAVPGARIAHCCLVEVDPGSGQVRILKYVVVHDCGRELNPLIVEGMVHGATAHGIGAALLAHLGVVVRSLPITPERVWRWLRASPDSPAAHVPHEIADGDSRRPRGGGGKERGEGAP
jgi:CO/xanthine dehydrogenase Mo-binding subunit